MVRRKNNQTQKKECWKQQKPKIYFFFTCAQKLRTYSYLGFFLSEFFYLSFFKFQIGTFWNCQFAHGEKKTKVQTKEAAARGKTKKKGTSQDATHMEDFAKKSSNPICRFCTWSCFVFHNDWHNRFARNCLISKSDLSLDTVRFSNLFISRCGEKKRLKKKKDK